MGITRYGTAGKDLILGTTTDDKLYGLEGDDTLDGLTGNDTLYGGAGNDSLHGDEGSLSFHGGAGNDTLSTGGTARMTAYFGRGDGQDLITGHPDWASTVNTLQFTGTLTKNDIAVSVSGTALVLSIRNSTDSVTIKDFYNGGPPMADGANIGGGMTGVQVVRFPDGTSWSLVELKALVFSGTSGADSIRGTYLADTLTGGNGNDTLDGQGGDDLIDGGPGNDSMVGGSGNDLYIVDSAGDVVVEYGVAGIDTVFTSISYTLGPHVENLTLTRRALNGTGNSLNNLLIGNSLGNAMMAGDGDDTLYGEGGRDMLYGEAGADQLNGGFDSDWLDGGEGNDTLDGGTGNDTLLGGNGDDTYFIDSTGDVVSETGTGTGTGSDVVISAIDYTLGANVECLDLMRGAPAALRGTGNALNNILIGNEFNNLLQGGGGDDQINGGDGNDVLDGGNGSNRIRGGAGDDTVIGSDTGADVLDGDNGNDWITGLAGNDLIDGGAGDDTIYGDAGNDWIDAGTDWINPNSRNYLDGGAGNDTLGGDRGADMLLGGAGDDLLSGNGGNDTVDGGSGNDILYGDSGTLSFHGGTGNDTLSPGAKASMTAYFGRGEGQDTIVGHVVVDSVTNTLQFTGAITKGDLDISVRNGSLMLSIRGTTDAVEITGFYSSASPVFGSNDVGGRMTGVHLVRFPDGSSWTMDDIRDILFAGTPGNDTILGSWKADTIHGGLGHDYLAGDAGNDFLDGGAGDDTLSGGGGLNTLAGGMGDDHYVLVNLTDTIVESVNGGTDTVVVRQDGYTLGSNLENLLVDAMTYSAEETASKTFSGTGNALDNTVEGNFLRNALHGLAGNDRLHGHGGMDTLYGGSGNDTLTGGADNDTLNGSMGNDTYLFARGDGSDLLQEVDRTLAEVDVLQLQSNIDREQVWWRKSGNDLEMSLIGTTDKVTIQNWYAGKTYHVEQFRTATGQVLLDTQVDQLVNAMAAFAPPAAGQTTLPAAYQAALNAVIAANWR